MRPSGIALSLAGRGAGALGGVALSVAAVRLGGAEALGQLAVLTSLAGLLGILSLRGLGQVLTREVGIMRAGGAAPCGSRGLLRRAAWLVARTSLPVALLGGAAAAILSGRTGAAPAGLPPPALWLFICAATPGIALLGLHAGYVSGLGRAWLAPLFQSGGVSLLAALLLAPVALAMPGGSDIARLCAALLGALALLCVPLALTLRAGGPSPEARGALAGQWAFTVAALSAFLLQAGSFLVAAPFLDAREIGLLRGAERLALVVGLVSLAVNAQAAPRLAAARGGRGLAGRTMAWGALLCALPAGLLLAAPEAALALLGPGFGEAAPYLRAMALAQLVSAALSPLQVALGMGGHERAVMRIGAAALALGLPALAAGAALFGAAGFAAAYAAVTCGRLLAVALAWRRIARGAPPGPARPART